MRKKTIVLNALIAGRSHEEAAKEANCNLAYARAIGADAGMPCLDYYAKAGKLTAQERMEVRDLARLSPLRGKQIAYDYNVSCALICRYKYGDYRGIQRRRPPRHPTSGEGREGKGVTAS